MTIKREARTRTIKPRTPNPEPINKTAATRSDIKIFI